ncbi:MAG TPA: hypothetical protein VIP75_04615 [Acidothermales bacterium]
MRDDIDPRDVDTDVGDDRTPDTVADAVDAPAQDEDAERSVPTTEVDDSVVDREDDGSPDTVDAPAQDGGSPDLVAGVDAPTVTDTAGADDRDQLMPGEAAAAPVGELWPAGAATSLQDRWHDLQLRFVDDPRGVVSEAKSLVSEAVQTLTTALSDQQRDLDGWESGGNGETEQLRVALQRYRDFFDRLTSLA